MGGEGERVAGEGERVAGEGGGVSLFDKLRLACFATD